MEAELQPCIRGHKNEPWASAVKPRQPERKYPCSGPRESYWFCQNWDQQLNYFKDFQVIKMYIPT
jgi:hypothetical protein